MKMTAKSFGDMGGEGFPQRRVMRESGEYVVTPKEAEELLDRCRYERQRKLRNEKVEQYVTSMKHGRFGLTALRVAVVGENQYLIDGQHRLWAVVLSGCSVRFYVIVEKFDTEEEVDEAYSNIDSGLYRTTSDAIRALSVGSEVGVPDAFVTKAGSAIRVIANGFERSGGSAWVDIGLTTRQQQALVPTLFKAEVKAYHTLLHPEGEGARRRGSASKNADVSAFFLRAPVMAVGLAVMRFQYHMAKELFGDAINGEILAKGKPAYALRTVVLTGAAQKKPVPWMTRAVAACWNAFYEGKEIGVVHPYTSKDILLLGTPWRGKGTSEKGRRQIAEIFAPLTGKDVQNYTGDELVIE